MRYGTSCFLQLLDDAPPPSSQNRILMGTNEHIARAEIKVPEIYPVCLIKLNMTMFIVPVLSEQRTMKLRMYLHHYILLEAYMKNMFAISPSEAIEIEACTRSQTLSDY